MSNDKETTIETEETQGGDNQTKKPAKEEPKKKVVKGEKKWRKLEQALFTPSKQPALDAWSGWNLDDGQDR